MWAVAGGTLLASAQAAASSAPFRSGFKFLQLPTSQPQPYLFFNINFFSGFITIGYYNGVISPLLSILYSFPIYYTNIVSSFRNRSTKSILGDVPFPLPPRSNIGFSNGWPESPHARIKLSLHGPPATIEWFMPACGISTAKLLQSI